MVAYLKIAQGIEQLLELFYIEGPRAIDNIKSDLREPDHEGVRPK